MPSTAVFWIALIASIAWALRVKEPARARRDLCAATAAFLGVFVAGYLLKFDTTRLPQVAWWMNGALAATAIVMIGDRGRFVEDHRVRASPQNRYLTAIWTTRGLYRVLVPVICRRSPAYRWRARGS